MVYGEYIQSFSIQQAVESQNFVPYATTCYASIWIANNMSQGPEPLDPTLLAKNVNFYYNNVQWARMRNRIGEKDKATRQEFPH